MKVRRREDNAEFPEQFVENIVSVGESRKLDAVAVHVEHDSLLASDDQFSQVAQRGGFAAKKLNQFVRIR